MPNTTATTTPSAIPTSSPREIEAGLLLQAATRLESVRSSWDSRKTELGEALLLNSQLWTDVLASIADAEHSLPADIRQSIANLAQFVTHQTHSLLSDPRPERLNPLININHELADGLLGRS
jgi:flagellar protein FlaF